MLNIHQLGNLIYSKRCHLSFTFLTRKTHKVSLPPPFSSILEYCFYLDGSQRRLILDSCDLISFVVKSSLLLAGPRT